MKAMKSLAIGLVGLGMSAAASAAPTPAWTDVYDPAQDIYFTNGVNLVGINQHGVPSYSFQHDLTDDGFVPGSSPEITSFMLTLELFDDSLVNGDDGAEWATIDLPGTAADETVKVQFFDVVTGISVEGLVQLNNSGMLDVTILHSGKNNQDFFFGGSTLVAYVPEPSTALLLGAGACMLGFASRRKQRMQVQSA